MKRATDHLEPSAKRRQDRQGRKGDEENSDEEDTDPGQFAKANEEVLKTRRIIKARRGGSGLASSNAVDTAAGSGQGGSSAAADSSSAAPDAAPANLNPFAGISILAPSTKAATLRASQTTAPAAASASVQPAKGELGSKDAVTAAGDSQDDAASRPPTKQQSKAEQASKGEPQQPPEDAPKSSQSPVAAKDSARAGASNTPAIAADSPQPTATAAAVTASVVQTSDTEKDTSAVHSKPESALLPESTAAAVSSEPATKASDGFTFGSVLAAKTSASGFGALAGASGIKAFGFGSLQASSQGSTTGAAAPAFQGFSARSETGDRDGPPAQQLFGAKPATPTTALLSGSPAGKVGEEEEELVTGEEDEQTVWSGDGTLFEFGADGWKERGRGQARVKVATAGRGRIVMRQRGNLRLLLNANLWPDMAVNTMDGGMGVTFAVHNAAAQDASAQQENAPDENGAKTKMATYAFRTKVQQTLTELAAAIQAHKKG